MECRQPGGEHEYRYILSVHADEIVSEGLWRRKLGASRTATLFEREGAEVVLGPTLRKLATAATFNPSLPYLSFLCINFDAPVVKEAASWFLGGVFLNYNSSYLERVLEQMLDEADSPEVTRFLRAVDVRIDGFRVEKAPEGRGQRVFVRHDVDGKGYELRLSEESAGTQKLMGLAAFLLAALERGGTVVVDELNAKLHPKLLRYVILLFKDPEVNKHAAQLIFSSQDVSTMRNDVFRRDEIWFAACGEGEASQLWSLADIHEANGNLVSKNAAFDKQYLSGRYGADPYLTRIEEWDWHGGEKVLVERFVYEAHFPRGGNEPCRIDVGRFANRLDSIGGAIEPYSHETDQNRPAYPFCCKHCYEGQRQEGARRLRQRPC